MPQGGRTQETSACSGVRVQCTHYVCTVCNDSATDNAVVSNGVCVQCMLLCMCIGQCITAYHACYSV
ncbi:unnamed protein product [Pneumocystis jirovecii]|uniref:Uncharacterized protein n=1 Tax=Pneumocystis jirovecii TaxID=42068 RepID=L0PBM8_PNEJI|nr:unnamed protein product [Pneumocystis jirovecii]